MIIIFYHIYHTRTRMHDYNDDINQLKRRSIIIRVITQIATTYLTP